MTPKTPFPPIPAALAVCLLLLATNVPAQSLTPTKTNWVIGGDELLRMALTNKLDIPLTPTKTNWVVGSDELIRVALTNNLDILITRIQPELDQYALSGLYGAYQPAVSASATHSYSSFPSGAVQTDSGLMAVATKEQVNSYTPGISGFTPWGLRYNFTGPLQEENVLGVPDLYSSQPSVSLAQPLLKNLWIDNTRYQISLARSTIKLDQLALRNQIMSVINNVQTAYFNLIAARETVVADKTAVDLAEQTVREDDEKVRVGALAPLDVKQAQSQAATARANLFSAQADLVAKEDTLKIVLSLRGADWLSVRLVPAEQLIAVPEQFEVRDCLRTALEHRPDVLQAKQQIEAQHVVVKFNFNQLFPELDVVGGYGRNATELTFNGNLDTIRQGTYPSYSYGLVLTIPLGNNTARYNYKSAKASLQQLVLQFQKLEVAVIYDIDNDIGRLRTDFRRVDATRQARIYAEDALEAEQLRLEHGAHTSFFVLQAQQVLTAARSAEILALASYNTDLEQLALDEGLTLDHHNIELRLR
jgi:outer membrane protein TolC